MPDLDRIAREIADETFSATHVPEMHKRLHVVILTALRRVEAETREECAKRCDQFHDTGVQHWQREKSRDRRMIVHAQALAGKCLANELRAGRLTDRTSKEGEA